MHRLVFLLALVVLCTAALPAAAQQQIAPVEVLPPEPLPVPEAYAALSTSVAAPGALEEARLLKSISRLYGYQSAILTAQAEGDYDRAERLFDQAIPELSALLARPGMTERPRFRAVYRALLTEYEAFHGAPADSLVLPQGGIFAFRERAFAALNDVGDPLLEDVSFPQLRPVQTEVPLTRNRLVRQSIHYLLSEPERHLYHWLSRAQTYFPMIEQILREEGAPDELKYLAMIESALNPQAVSWAGAVGMWQFMPATGRAYDLQVTGWIDERRDPEKPTRAAARHLVDLYERFGDWHLAIAGYNCGAGNVRSALRRARRNGRPATFWGAYPYLPRETRNYVPMYIAAALTASNPAAFDLDLSAVEDAPAYAYTAVPIQGSLSLRNIARLSGTSVDAIRALNPEIRRAYTPPSEGAYPVRIPYGTYARFAEGYARLPDNKKRPLTQHVVRRGDTLSEIAGRYGVSIGELRRRNGIRGSVIHPGQHLVVPVPHYESDLTLAEAGPVSVRYRTRSVQPLVAMSELNTRRNETRPAEQATRRPEQKPAEEESVIRTVSMESEPEEEPIREEEPAEEPQGEEPESNQPQGERTTYTVRSGDTLGEIAERHGVSASELRQWDDVAGNRIYPGQDLVMYGAGEPSLPARLVHRVRSGDTLSEIAAQYGVSSAELRAWNGLSSSRIRVGQRLTVYPDGGHIVYRVQGGDNLIEIAREYGVSVQQLKQWNGLRSNLIRPGQQLKIHT